MTANCYCHTEQLAPSNIWDNDSVLVAKQRVVEIFPRKIIIKKANFIIKKVRKVSVFLLTLNTIY